MWLRLMEVGQDCLGRLMAEADGAQDRGGEGQMGSGIALTFVGRQPGG